MIEEVEVYKTNDGKYHDTIEKAQKHVIDQVCEFFDKRLQILPKERFTRSDIYKIVTTLVGDFDNINDIYNKLDKILG